MQKYELMYCFDTNSYDLVFSIDNKIILIVLCLKCFVLEIPLTYSTVHRMQIVRTPLWVEIRHEANSTANMAQHLPVLNLRFPLFYLWNNYTNLIIL